MGGANNHLLGVGWDACGRRGNGRPVVTLAWDRRPQQDSHNNLYVGESLFAAHSHLPLTPRLSSTANPLWRLVETADEAVHCSLPVGNPIETVAVPV